MALPRKILLKAYVAADVRLGNAEISVWERSDRILPPIMEFYEKINLLYEFGELENLTFPPIPARKKIRVPGVNEMGEKLASHYIQ